MPPPVQSSQSFDETLNMFRIELPRIPLAKYCGASACTDLGLSYILRLFCTVIIVVRNHTDFRNLPLLMSFIQENSPRTKIHLLLWQIQQNRVQDFLTATTLSSEPPSPSTEL